MEIAFWLVLFSAFGGGLLRWRITNSDKKESGGMDGRAPLWFIWIKTGSFRPNSRAPAASWLFFVSIFFDKSVHGIAGFTGRYVEYAIM